MSDNQEMCACINVEYNPIHNIDGSCSDRWTCKLCGSHFIKESWLKNFIGTIAFDGITMDTHVEVSKCEYGEFTVTIYYGQDKKKSTFYIGDAGAGIRVRCIGGISAHPNCGQSLTLKGREYKIEE